MLADRAKRTIEGVRALLIGNNYDFIDKSIITKHRFFLEFSRIITAKIFAHPDLADALLKYHEFEIFLSELFSIVYRCGNCGEHIRLTLANFLREGFNKSIELVAFLGNKNNKKDRHGICVLDRDAKSDITDPTTWGAECRVVESWGKSPEFYKIDNNNIQRLTKHALDSVDYKNTISFARFDKNFSDQDWQEVVNFLTRAKAVITPELIKDSFAAAQAEISADRHRYITFPDIQEEYKKILQVFDEQIKFYLVEKNKKLIHAFPGSYGRLFSDAVKNRVPPIQSEAACCCTIS